MEGYEFGHTYVWQGPDLDPIDYNEKDLELTAAEESTTKPEPATTKSKKKPGEPDIDIVIDSDGS